MVRTTLEDLFGLRGHRALVTGASAGLGVELAETLAIAGADVALVARRGDRLREQAASLADLGVRTAVVEADLTSAGAASVFDLAEAELGPIDILVNNAGRHLAVRAERTTREQWRGILELNLDAVFALAQELARRRLRDEHPWGRVINLGSVLGAVASSTPGLAAYVAAKGAVQALTRQLAIEWGPKGITVNAIAPGYFPTELNASDFENPKVRDRIVSFTPVGRLGRPGELRTALLFLASPESGYVNGTTVFVDGGYTAW